MFSHIDPMPNGYFGLGATASSLTPSLRAVIQMSNGRIALPSWRRLGSTGHHNFAQKETRFGKSAWL